MPGNNNSINQQYESLREAIRRNKKDIARNLLLDNAPVNPIKKYAANTPLHWAIKNYEDIEFITMLLDKGADIYAKNHHRRSSLETAVDCSRADILKLLLSKSTHIDEDLQLLIIEATKNDNKTLLQMLVEYAIEARVTVSLPSSIDIAAKEGYVESLAYLLNYYKPHLLGLQNIPIQFIKHGPKSLEIFNLLSQHGFSVSDEDKNNFEFVYTAADAKCFIIVKNAVEGGIDVNQVNEKTGYSLLHVACINKDAVMVKFLIDYNADLNIRVVVKKVSPSPCAEGQKFLNKTPLFIAVHNSDAKIIKLLLKSGAQIKNEPNILMTAVQQSSNKNCLKIIQILLDNGAEIDQPDDIGISPLFYSIVDTLDLYERFSSKSFYTRTTLNDDTTKKEIVELLLKRGANSNVGHINASPLQAAIAEGYLNIVKLLLQYIADINHTNVYGNSPLHFAVKADPAILDAVLQRNPNFNISNNDLMTPLHIVVCQSNAKRLKKILPQCIGNINKGDKDGNTPLHTVCRTRQSLGIINYLLKNGADVNALNYKGETPLHTFAKHGWYIKFYGNVIETLLKYKANFNAVDYSGKTPLIAACKENNGKIARLLLKNGADINLKVPSGTTLIHYAINHHYTHMFEFSLKYGADINIICENQRTALNYIKDAIDDVDMLTDPLEGAPEINENIKTVVQYRIQIYTIAREHIIKLKCAKLPVNKTNHDMIYENFELQETVDTIINRYGYEKLLDISKIEDNCKKEIKELKLKTIGYSTLYDFLTKDIHDVAKFAKNEQLKQTLQSNEFIKKYSLYSEIIKNRFAEAVTRNELVENAEKWAHSTIFCRLPMSCVNHILRYLDHQNLNEFTETIKQLSMQRE